MERFTKLAACLIAAFMVAAFSPAIVTLFATQKIDLSLLLPTSPGLAVASVAIAGLAFAVMFTSSRTAQHLGKPLAFLGNVAGGAIAFAAAMWAVTWSYAAAFSFDDGAPLVLNVASTIWAPAIGTGIVLAAAAAFVGIRFGDTAFAKTHSVHHASVFARIRAFMTFGSARAASAAS